ncbi:hypothetical protein [Agarivorans sp. 1_MG-2023]|uniref:hypothetical protein n=1 Tax=Agarivorans sp. 1_MG-2023 TaxID=3062634 RepID=UPI0026E1665E|nr:hypothetical protein [Agarivorans sp. 1_MG-2023]MDO6762136.1 hypothetical protein [Agarivorans sp. 1_MG-2023]
MKKIIVLLALATPMLANASEPKDAGKTFAQITACHLAGEIDKSDKDAANFKVIARYKIAGRNHWWKKDMKKAQKKEFRRLDNTNKLELAIMCGIIENKWL